MFLANLKFVVAFGLPLNFLLERKIGGYKLLLSKIETTRLMLSSNTDVKKKSRLGQFFTSSRTAAFMASLFPDADGCCRLLDAGAGIGSLSAAFLERWVSSNLHFESIELDAFEIDESLHPYLNHILATYENNPKFIKKIWKTDFIHAASDWLSGNLFAEELPTYTHAILNPPYKKIKSASSHRIALRRIGIETVNLYSAFVALAVELSVSGGQIVAIIPRSFCNGPYYRPFRQLILNRATIRQIHLFGSRNKAFKDDDVLQENVIIRLERDGRPSPVAISTSTDDSFNDLAIYEHPLERIIFPDDPERFIHVPTSPENTTELLPTMNYSLTDLGINVSTGPVVDFRLKEHLRYMPESDTVPLLYPAHFNSRGTLWPKADMKKPNAIKRNSETERWLYPNGFYCVVRRFSTKEEKRRIVASVVEPSLFADASVLGFENHLNIFHDNKKGLPQSLAHGLSVYLNSSEIDKKFRCFNGHTQVNATDLKQIKYPSRNALIELGKWAMKFGEITQNMIDEKLGTLLV